MRVCVSGVGGWECSSKLRPHLRVVPTGEKEQPAHAAAGTWAKCTKCTDRTRRAEVSSTYYPTTDAPAALAQVQYVPLVPCPFRLAGRACTVLVNPWGRRLRVRVALHRRVPLPTAEPCCAENRHGHAWLPVGSSPPPISRRKRRTHQGRGLAPSSFAGCEAGRGLPQCCPEREERGVFDKRAPQPASISSINRRLWARSPMRQTTRLNDSFRQTRLAADFASPVGTAGRTHKSSAQLLGRDTRGPALCRPAAD